MKLQSIENYTEHYSHLDKSFKGTCVSREIRWKCLWILPVPYDISVFRGRAPFFTTDYIFFLYTIELNRNLLRDWHFKFWYYYSHRVISYPKKWVPGIITILQMRNQNRKQSQFVGNQRILWLIFCFCMICIIFVSMRP